MHVVNHGRILYVNTSNYVDKQCGLQSYRCQECDTCCPGINRPSRAIFGDILRRNFLWSALLIKEYRSLPWITLCCWSIINGCHKCRVCELKPINHERFLQQIQQSGCIIHSQSLFMEYRRSCVYVCNVMMTSRTIWVVCWSEWRHVIAMVSRSRPEQRPCSDPGMCSTVPVKQMLPQ